MHAQTHVHPPTCTLTHAHTDTHARSHACTHTHAHTQTCTHTHTYTRTHTHTHIHTHKHTGMHTHSECAHYTCLTQSNSSWPRAQRRTHLPQILTVFSSSTLRRVDVLGATVANTPPYYDVNVTLTFQVSGVWGCRHLGLQGLGLQGLGLWAFGAPGFDVTGLSF